MIRVDQNEQFPITVSLVDEGTGTTVSGATVAYDVREMDDSALSPPVNGTLDESIVEPGIYRTSLSIPTDGNYVCYLTSATFLPNTEEIIVNPENIYDLVKQTRHYNISVEDVIRTNGSPTASQTARNVPFGQTDYIVTNIKTDTDVDWTGTPASGIVYAWYQAVTDDTPYKMGGPL